MKNNNTTIITDIFQSYALAFFFTIALGNMLVILGHRLSGGFIFYSDVVSAFGNTLAVIGKLLEMLAPPVIAFSMGTNMRISKIGTVSLVIVGAMCMSTNSAFSISESQIVFSNPLTSGTSALLSFILSFILVLLINKLDRLTSGFQLIIYPLIAILFSYIGITFGSHVIDQILSYLANLLIKWGGIASTASGFEMIFKYCEIAILSGLLFTSPIGMFGIVPFLTANNVTFSATSMSAACCGVMSFMIGLGLMTFLSRNSPDNSVGVMLGTPTLQFGNILKRPQIILAPALAACLSTLLSVTFFDMNVSYEIMKWGNCCFHGLINLYSTNGFGGIISVTIVYLLVPALVSIVVYAVLVRLNLLKVEDLEINFNDEFNAQ